MPTNPPTQNKPDAPPEVIFNVERTGYFINVKTERTNHAYQAKFGSSKWKYYELVMTQWNTSAVSPTEAGDPSVTFPGYSASSAFANTVMETFFQTRRDLSCLGCHSKVGTDADFAWSFKIERPDSHNLALKQLENLLAGTGIFLR